jgi:tetratricopeptide (TPR) repeat protein
MAITALGLFALIAGFLFSSAKVHGYRGNLPAEQLRAEALMVDPTLLKIISGEFKGLMADYLNLKAAVFKGGAHETTEEDWVAMYTLFKQSIELDPYFFHTGYYTQGMMAWRKGMHEKAIEILKIHADHRHWDWEPKFYLGFDYFYYLKDNETGAHYMRAASKLEGAPPLVLRLAARLMQRSGQTLTAIAFLKSMIERAEDEDIKENLIQRLKAHLGVYQLEQARDRYQNEIGHLPPTLSDIVDKGYIQEIPENTMADTFFYDSRTGEIGFDAKR